MFLEILKAILMGIVEGITEWLPISSTGHMILVEQVVKFNASEEFMSMFRVVIQLGAILAVVVLFWNKLWPFGLRHGRVCSKPAVWQLWFKVVAATIPVLIISPLDDWFEARFYNYITVAAMLILYGVLFILVENRRTAPHVTRLEQITYREAFIVGVWQMLAIIPGTSRSGATIVGGLLLGLSRACVAEFTFYLAIPVIEREALAWAVASVDNHEIDKINILNASILAMHRALDQLKVRPGHIIVDGNRFKKYRDIPKSLNYNIFLWE